MYEAAQDIRGEEGPSAAAERWRRESAANSNRKTAGFEGASRPGSSSRRPQGAARVYNMEQEELDAHKTAMVNLLNAGENFDQVLEDVAEDGLLNQTLLDLLVDRMEVCMCVCALPPPRERCHLQALLCPWRWEARLDWKLECFRCGEGVLFLFSERVEPRRRRRRAVPQLAKRGMATAGALSGLALIINRVQNEFMERNSPPAIVLLEQCLKLHVSQGEEAARKHLYGVLSGQARVRARPILCILVF